MKFQQSCVSNKVFFCLILLFVGLMSASVTHAETYTFVTKWGSEGNGNGQFYIPIGAFIDSSDNVFVADTGNNRIQKFDSRGTFLKKWGSEGSSDGQFYGPNDVAVDSLGNVFVVDTGNNRIQKFDSRGTFLKKWGSEGSSDGQFSLPLSVAIDSSDNVYVADTRNNRIQKFDSNGNFIKKWGSNGDLDGQFDYPMGIAVDSSGNVYVADSWNSRIQKFDSNGKFLTKLGSRGSSDSQYLEPTGIVIDSSDNIYVADMGNHRIQKFSSSGAFLTKWGSQGSGDGQFNQPYDVAIDSLGNVYVVDTNNNRIQKFALEKPNNTKLVADFSASPTSGKAPLIVNFTDTSTGSPTSWQWTFGDGTSSKEQNPVHKYTKSGNYTVILRVWSGAALSTVTKSNYISVTNPVADFSASPTYGKAPLIVNFRDNSTGLPNCWYWNFGDGTSSKEKNPVHKYTKPGNYTVMLRVWSGTAMSTITKSNYISVISPPVAAFYATPISGKAPLTVKFIDKSTGLPKSWYWDFGDGSTSNLQSPTHTYTLGGDRKYYTVSLTVQNEAGVNTKKTYNYIRVSK